MASGPVLQRWFMERAAGPRHMEKRRQVQSVMICASQQVLQSCIAGELNSTTNCSSLRRNAKSTSHRIFHQARNKGQDEGRRVPNRIILGTKLLIRTAKQSFVYSQIIAKRDMYQGGYRMSARVREHDLWIDTVGSIRHVAVPDCDHARS